jgi:peptide/nickel transport system substrate-binding protein
MSFPFSKAKSRRLGGPYVRFLHNMGIRGPQGLSVALLTLLASMAGVACTRHHGGPRRPAATTARDDGGAPGTHRTAVRSPAGVRLPEIAPKPSRPDPYGGTLHVHLEAEPPHLNPLQDQLQIIQRVVGNLVYETLIECRENQYRPGLAESWEVSPDGERVTIKLRSGARWHDDRVVSGLDVQATFEPLLRTSSHQAIWHAMLEDIEGVDVLPDHAARFRLRRPSDLTLRALCEIPILPAESLRKAGSAVTQLGRQPVGTGPFRFSSWERGKRIRLVRSRPAERPRPPFLDEIVFEIDGDGSRALVRTRRGEIDILPRVLDVLYPEQVAPATLRDTLELWWLTPDRTSFVVPNHRRGPLGDARFRQALSLLWDRARFADEVHHGLTRPVGAPTFAQVPPDPMDRMQAVSLLEAAGFRDTDGDGVRDVGGVPIRLTFLLPAGARSLAAEVRGFALDLRRAGLLLDTATVDPGTLQARLDRGDFDLATLTWEGRRDEDPRPLCGSQGQLNFIGYRSEHLQSLLDQVRLAPGPAARVPALQQVGEWLASERPVIFLYRHDVPALVAKRVHGLAGVGDRLDLRSVWVDP